ncbi:hypothetical protein JNJ66_03250 [Candidatus Saccharibacteria bacterium]|nr:hypothetical protein [Candidatus Saccharibacteria bacterium]
MSDSHNPDAPTARRRGALQLVLLFLASTILSLAAAGTATAQPVSEPEGGPELPVVTVTNASDGVFWRLDSYWGSSVNHPGAGVYDGDRVRLECYKWGNVVPPLNNNGLWYQATVISGRGTGSGMVNDHFLITGFDLPEILLPNVPPCEEYRLPQGRVA